ncbi:aldehyde dehydrogenase family protein [Pseudonocardia kujensis]|uniref:aldehyde dehydrogenase family protein n=1 Tax=Pseudonocardia kujensis TaxID=1128675 RepID=UPI001E39C74C|nr:aldehyde dehydrogenase family protein [Pseudonocardia kujensis]MCE0765585.1 aldehyde dehydrogenase family protein [Pseudonocardia kujensis]
MNDLRNYIDGIWRPGGGRPCESIDPAVPTRVVARWRLATDSDVDAAVAAASAASVGWARENIHERAQYLRRAAVLLRERAAGIAADLTAEQGKIAGVARGEVERAASILDFFAHDAVQSLGESYSSPRPKELILTHRVPVGPTLVVTPWNVPLAIPAWKIAPALVHGNTVVWKPSEHVPLVATHLMEALADAGLPAGVCNMVLGGGSAASRALEAPVIKACTFTGSTAVGLAIEHAAAARHIPVLTEMGGMNAAIVLDDADLDLAAEQIVAAATGWSGQRCTATSRVVVQRGVAERFTKMLQDTVALLRVGDPLDATVEVGPVTTRRQFDELADAAARARRDGELLAGGVAGAAEDGYFVSPMLVRGLPAGHELARTEIFGPLVVIMEADDLDDALAEANDSDFGLSGSLFTRDLDCVLEALDRFDVGVLHVNSESTGADPHVPFGGFKLSGTPHKEMGQSARDFFTRVKTVYLRSGSR